MSKKLILITIIFLTAVSIGKADFLGIKKNTESIAFPLNQPLDSAYGIERKPDSAHVVAYVAGAITAAYKATSTNFPFSDIYIDTTKDFGDTLYWYSGLISSIDGSGALGVLSIDVSLFYDNLATHTLASVQIISDSLENMLDAAKDSSAICAVKSRDIETDVVSIAGDVAANGTLINGVQGEVANLNGWDPANDAVPADIVSISDDNTAADNLEAILDGTRAKLYLSQLSIVADGNDDAIQAIGSGYGNGFAATGGYDGGHGIYGHGYGGGNGATLYGDNTNGSGLSLFSSGIGHDMVLAISNDISNLDGTSHILMSDDSVVIDVSSNTIYADSIANRVLEDSSHYKGGTATIDSTIVARAVWNTPQGNHTLAGTFGKYLDAEVSGLAGGSGFYTYQIVAFDSSINQVVPGAGISIRNLDQTALIAVGFTDVSGTAAFNLDNENYLVVTSSPGYIFESFDTIIVAGGGVDTALGYRFDPGAPEDPSLCRVYGYLYDINGNPENNAIVSGWLPLGVSCLGQIIVSPFQVEAVSDENGYFYLDLIPSSDLTPADSKYEITITLSDGTVLRERILVPDTDNWQLTW